MEGNAEDRGQCLTEETLTDYLDGGLEPAMKAASEAHLIGCDRCRKQLAFFMRLLKGEIASDEARVLEEIQAEWARAKSDGPPLRRRSVDRRWFLASGGVAAALLLAVGARLALNHVAEPNSAQEVIDLLLAERRPFEGRLSGQKHLPFSAQRGPDEPDTSVALLSAQMSRLAANNHEWGRFYLIQRDFDRAIAYLETAEQQPGAPPELHNDLGVAYMESGRDEGQSKAVDQFRRALATKPDFAAAAFNLALIYERMGRATQAEMQWKTYLRIESDPAWSREATSKLEEVTH